MPLMWSSISRGYFAHERDSLCITVDSLSIYLSRALLISSVSHSEVAANNCLKVSGTIVCLNEGLNFLAGLSVGPEFQGKGVARLLVNWGVERCFEETAHTGMEDERPDRRRVCTLIARPAGRRLYEKAGFRALCSGSGDVMTLGHWDVCPDHVMIWDPTGAWTEESGVPSTHAEGLKDYVK